MKEQVQKNLLIEKLLSYNEAIYALKQGKPILFPTDTVYGLGAAVQAAKSPQALYDIKSRAANKPIAWLVNTTQDLLRYGKDVPAYARVLAQMFWPGALTLVVKASTEVPRAFCSDENTIGLRMPASNCVCLLIEGAGQPLATTSANRAGENPVKSALDLDETLLERAAGYIEDTPAVSQSFVSATSQPSVSPLASTVLDCTAADPRILREGAISARQIQEAIAPIELKNIQDIPTKCQGASIECQSVSANCQSVSANCQSVPRNCQSSILKASQQVYRKGLQNG